MILCYCLLNQEIDFHYSVLDVHVWFIKSLPENWTSPDSNKLTNFQLQLGQKEKMVNTTKKKFIYLKKGRENERETNI